MGTLTVERRGERLSFTEEDMAATWRFDPESQMLIYRWGGNSDPDKGEIRPENVIFHTPINEAANLAGAIDSKGKAHTLMPGKGMRIVFPDGIKRNVIHQR